MRSLPALLLIVLTLLVSTSARAAEAGEDLSISLLTMGPGEHPFTKFGHNAIWVHDARTERDEIYNYGTFAFDSPTALLDSVQGKLPYWLSVQSLSGTLLTYQDQGRSLLASELELTPAQRAELHAALRENARPEHRYYRYDYYRDNCATRVRDVIDRALGGQLEKQWQKPASMSYRAHTLRLVADDPLLDAGLDLAIGRQTDSAVTLWDEGWLPERLHDLLASARIERGGREFPLIRSEHLLLDSRLPKPRATPPNWTVRYGLVGVGLGVALLLVGFLARNQRAWRSVLAIALIVIGVPLGLLGSALCYLTFFSFHSAAADNYNVLLLPPWLLGLGVAAVGMLRGKAWGFRVATWATTGAALTTDLALVLRLVTSHPQANAQELMVALPIWLSATLAVFLARPAAEQH